MTVDDLVTSHEMLLRLLKASKNLVDDIERKRGRGGEFGCPDHLLSLEIAKAQKHVDEKG